MKTKFMTAALISLISLAAQANPKLLWSNSIAADMTLKLEAAFDGKNISALFSDEKFYDGNDWIYSFDHQGNIRWKFKDNLDGKNHSLQYKPVLETENGNVYVMGSKSLIALNEQGKLLWNFNFYQNLGNFAEGCKLLADNNRILTGCYELSSNTQHKPLKNLKKIKDNLSIDTAYFFNKEGKLLWQHTFAGRIYHMDFYDAESVLILDGSRTLSKVSNTGDVLQTWYGVNDFDYENNVLLILSNGDTLLSAYDENNQEIWHSDVPNFFGEPTQTILKQIDDKIFLVNVSEEYVERGIAAATILDSKGNLLRYKKITDNVTTYGGVTTDGKIYFGYFNAEGDKFSINVLDDQLIPAWDKEFYPVNGSQSQFSPKGSFLTLDENNYLSQFAK